MRKLIQGLDRRKKEMATKVKESNYPTPGLMATEIMLNEAQVERSDPKLAKSYLNAIREALKKS